MASYYHDHFEVVRMERNQTVDRQTILNQDQFTVRLDQFEQKHCKQTIGHLNTAYY